MKNQWVLCLGAGASQVPLIRCAQRLGYCVAAVDRDSQAPGFSLADLQVNESTCDLDGILRALPTKPWAGLLARCTGQALFTAAGLVEYFGLPGISEPLANVSTSKSSLREFCQEHDLPVPHGMCVTDADALSDVFPGKSCVVKPDFTLVGKKSIRQVTGKAALCDAVCEAAAASGNGAVEVEEFIQGIDCSYLAFVHSGAAEIIFAGDELVYFDEDGVLQSVGMSTPLLAVSSESEMLIRQMINTFAACFPEVCAPVAFSFRIDPEGMPWLIEVHADLTGDGILDLLAPAATGSEFMEALVEVIIQGELTKRFRQRCMLKKWVPTVVIYSNELNELPDGCSTLLLQEETLFALHQKIATFFPDGLHSRLQVLQQVKGLQS